MIFSTVIYKKIQIECDIFSIIDKFWKNKTLRFKLIVNNVNS